MHKKGLDRFTIILILGGAIILFAILAAGIVYNALETGTILGFNITSPSNTTVDEPVDGGTNITLHEGECFFTDAYWSDGSSSLNWVQSGQEVQLVLETSGCEGNLTTFSLFKSVNGTIVSLLQSLPITIHNGEARFSWITEANISLTTSYYFIATLTGTTMTERSPSIGIEAPLEPILFDPLLCHGFNNDQDYLYNISTLIFARPDGKKTFTSDINGTLIRANLSTEKFYTDYSNGALTISYDILPTCGGVDVKYTISNPTSQPHLLPNFFIEGIILPKTSAKYLYPKEWGTLVDAPPGNGMYYQIPYPNDVTYSPVMVAVNDQIAVGTSFQYPYLTYRQNVQPFLYWNTDSANTHAYNLQYTTSLGDQIAYINAGETRTYTITLRFAPRKNWLLTLYPYKQYFNTLYDSVRPSRSKNLNPVAGFFISYVEYQNNIDNPRGYLPDFYAIHGIPERNRIDLNGWANTTSWMINTFTSFGYKRSMIWLSSGAYNDSLCNYCNFPPQFMDWLPKLVETQSELLRIKQAGISLGYWWGNAGSVPIPRTWTPSRIEPANYSSNLDRAFLEEQFELARQRGADEIGLDAFTLMNPYGRYQWTRDMQTRDSSINLIHEIGGPDFMHAMIGNFYTDTYDSQRNTWNYIGAPHLLSWYLNPNSEIWIWGFLSYDQFLNLGGDSFTTARARQLTQWGYTYVNIGSMVNVTDWDLDISDCLDGIDNDRDGKIDWPRDSGCASELDLSED